MFALCACSASARRYGTACSLMNAERSRSVGYVAPMSTRRRAIVFLVPFTVVVVRIFTVTPTGPQRMSTLGPVQVFVTTVVFALGAVSAAPQALPTGRAAAPAAARAGIARFTGGL